MEYQQLKSFGGWTETRKNRHKNISEMVEALKGSGNKYVTVSPRRDPEWPEEISLTDRQGRPHFCRVRVSPSVTSAQQEVKGARPSRARTSRKVTAA